MASALTSSRASQPRTLLKLLLGNLWPRARFHQTTAWFWLDGTSRGGMGDLRRGSTNALTQYLNAGGEAALSEGYELAREAVGQGVSLLDLVDFHGSAIA